MRLKRLLSLATALGLAATMSVPTGALAHDIDETMARFDGNYLMVSAGPPSGPVGEVRLDVYQGKIGRVKEATLVTAGVYSSRWEPAEGPDTCRVERTQWIGQSGDSPPDPYVTNVEFTSPYSGTLTVVLELHGRHLIHNGVLMLSDEGYLWCDYEFEPVLVTDLGERDFTAAATWDSMVEGKGRNRTVRTSVLFETLVFDGSSLTPGDDQVACSMARKMPIPVFEFIE